MSEPNPSNENDNESIDASTSVSDSENSNSSDNSDNKQPKTQPNRQVITDADLSTNAPVSQKKPTSRDNTKSTVSIKRSSLPFRRRKASKANDTNVLPSDDRRRQRLLDNQNDENYSTMSIGDRQEVLLLIRGMAERVVIEVGTTYKLGRFEIGATTDDEIDMTPYGAQDRGVSRVHAQLQIIDGVVHITDLGSTNGTFVNTKQLEPQTPTPLRKGDELLLGRLAVQVLFR